MLPHRCLLFVVTFLMCCAPAFAKEPPVAAVSTEESPAEKKEEKKEKEGETPNDDGASEAEQTVKIGNLSFPPSQQPNPLVSFGQNVLNKKQAQFEFMITDFAGRHQYLVTLTPTLLYGFTDELSLYLQVPIASRYKVEDHHSSGVGDVLIQLEYAFYTKAYTTYYDQATIVVNVTLPTGSSRKTPPTGLGVNSFFLGGTWSRMEIDWFYFVSPAGIITASSHHVEPGGEFLYQGGIGRRIWNDKEWLFDWMVEFDGTYVWRDRVHGVLDPNTGGNVFYITPSLFLASENTTFALGVGWPVYQHLFGHQIKDDYLIIFNSTWTF